MVVGVHGTMTRKSPTLRTYVFCVSDVPKDTVDVSGGLWPLAWPVVKSPT